MQSTDLVDAMLRRDTIRGLVLDALRKAGNLPPELQLLITADNQLSERMRELLEVPK